MAEVTIDVLLGCLDLCEYEQQIHINALRYLYNLCYRCESGQTCILQRKPKKLINKIRSNFSGDATVNTQLRRFELAIQHNGWRGNVEDIVEKEMKEDEVKSTLLKSVNKLSFEEFEAMFNGTALLNARTIEDDMKSYATHSVDSHMSKSQNSYRPTESNIKSNNNNNFIEGDDSFLLGSQTITSEITHK